MSGEWLDSVTQWLAANPGMLTLALFGTAFLESLALAGVVVPGVAVLFAIAVMAGQTAMPVSEALVWAGAGAIAGDTASFALGRAFQGKLHTLWPLNRYPGLIDKGERFFKRHGGKSVIIGRFIGPVRPIIPLVAGAFLMPWRRFLAFNLASAVGWAPVYIIPGYLVGSAMASDIQPPPHFYAVIALSAAILCMLYYLLFRFQLGLGRGGRAYEWLADRMAEYNATHRFWRLYTSRRPDQTGEFPLPSLMLGIGALALFAATAQLASATDLLTSFNQTATDWMQQLRHPLLDRLFVAMTLLGSPLVLAAGAALVSAALTFRGFYAAATHIIGAALACLAMVWATRQLTALTQPDLITHTPISSALPSAHTASTALGCGLFAAFVAGENQLRMRWQQYLMFSVPIVLVALSRLYLGVHWFTDVLSGILLGLGIAGLARASFSRFDKTPIAFDPVLGMALIIWAGLTVWFMADQWSESLRDYSLAVAG